MRFTVKENTGRECERFPYYIQVEIISPTINLSSNLHIPVFVQETTDEKFYTAEACGYQVHAVDLNELPHQVDRLIRSLMVTGRLPSYVFIARHGNHIYPVYTVGDEVTTAVPNGPAFRHIELAKIREYLEDYLFTSGVLGAKDDRDKLHIRGVHRKSLALVRPICYLKKRAVGEETFWSPVFLTEDGSHIYTFAASAKREVPIAAGREFLNIQRIVAEVLITDKRLSKPHDLRIDRLFPEQLAQVLSHFQAKDETLIVEGISLPLYRFEDGLIAVEDRPEEDRYSLFFGQGLDDLQDRIERSFKRRGILAPHM